MNSAVWVLLIAGRRARSEESTSLAGRTPSGVPAPDPRRTRTSLSTCDKSFKWAIRASLQAMRVRSLATALALTALTAGAAAAAPRMSALNECQYFATTSACTRLAQDWWHPAFTPGLSRQAGVLKMARVEAAASGSPTAAVGIKLSDRLATLIKGGLIGIFWDNLAAMQPWVTRLIGRGDLSLAANGWMVHISPAKAREASFAKINNALNVCVLLASDLRSLGEPHSLLAVYTDQGAGFPAQILRTCAG